VTGGSIVSVRTSQRPKAERLPVTIGDSGPTDDQDRAIVIWGWWNGIGGGAVKH